MWWLILSAWVMGFVGSTHCIGMCGPLAMSLPMRSQQVPDRMFSALVYNLGRITTYAFYGSLIGLTQSLVLPFLFQHELSVIIGILLVLMSIYFLVFKKTITAFSNNRFYQLVTITLGKLYQKNSIQNLYFIGVLNGLLPCGLVYLALASAFATGTMYKSILFMSFFGLGTLPAMWSMVFFAQYFSPLIRTYLRKIYPFIFAITGIMLIMRGLSDAHDIHEGIQTACRK
ncbi:MAG: sulfite exporter TauE/SafE family protein [Bacteroidetes bacterium]|jgi:sulfite exporter TauE/SafE|nr:sulfite exporter TauE/SafE family protein [Bacteroidota bacterium]HQW45469.1 sulfite exporter TauE/SafE family protein [Chitinophagaceae bacterium]MBK6819256.1 sulfite exporter TauE/SafE family protein [Bacteroidota bacterium]MBK7041650.1 sulfite exporter TauE/SafE family protein [Bacteroidota bacterium]MBK8330079.1 sulfite exporter TauE/SafE family protein [Bacteroidota bacterium]